MTPYRVGVNAPTWYQTGSTRSNGRFTVEPIDAGSWQLQMRDNEGVWESRWYDSASRSGDQVFPLAEGTTVNNLATRRATFTIKVVRKATGGRPDSKVTVSLGGVSRTVSVTKGVAKVTLTGLPTGKQNFQAATREPQALPMLASRFRSRFAELAGVTGQGIKPLLASLAL